ncbi:MAG: DUF1801 domain-containing protein [Planctomycetota bacterium]
MAKRADKNAKPPPSTWSAKRADYGAPVDGYVAKLPSPQKEIAQAVRRIIRKAAPEASEAIKWGQPTYELAGMLCYFVATKDRIRFGFFNQAIRRNDAENLPEGVDENLRHIKLRSLADVNPELFGKWVKRAVDLNKGACK